MILCCGWSGDVAALRQTRSRSWALMIGLGGRKSMRQIRSAIGAMTIDPKLMCQRPKSGGTVLCLLPLKRLRFQPPAAFDLYRYPRTKKEQGEPTLAELVKKCLFLHKSKASPAGEPVQRPCYGRSRPSYRQAKPSTPDPDLA